MKQGKRKREQNIHTHIQTQATLHLAAASAECEVHNRIQEMGREKNSHGFFVLLFFFLSYAFSLSDCLDRNENAIKCV